MVSEGNGMGVGLGGDVADLVLARWWLCHGRPGD